MAIAQAQPSTRPARLVVIGPRDSMRLLDKVAGALRQRGHSVCVPAITSRPEAWVKTYAALLGPGTAVIVVPRPDGSIGEGTAMDVHRAQHTRGVQVMVVRPDGHLVPLEQADLTPLADGERSDKCWARFAWPT